MRRLLATLRLDVVNQFRQGFYLASVVVVLVLAGIATQLPIEAGVIVPAILLTNMTIATFVFVGGLVLLEKGEGTLEAMVNSPLRPHEYLASKVVTLTLLAVIENVAITAIAISTGLLDSVSWGWILLASALTGALYTTLGFLTVIRYESLNEFLFPMIFATVLLELPGAVCFGMPEFPALAVLPTYALLWAFRSALEPVPAGTLIYAIAYPLLWLIVALFVGRKMLRSYVAGQLGGATP